MENGEIECVIDLLYELFKQDNNEAYEFLKEEGVNINELGKKNRVFMDKLLKRVWFNNLKETAKTYPIYKFNSERGFADWEDYYNDGFTPIEALEESIKLH